MIVTTEVHSLLTVEFLLWHTVRTRVQLVIEWTEQLFNKGMTVVAVKVVWALIPVAVLLHVRALFKRADKIEVRWSPEVLLPVSIVAFRPFVFLVYYGAEACLICVDHELLKTHLLLECIQILRKAPLGH